MYRARRGSKQGGPWLRNDISTVAAIYGSNAAGKSTFVEALRFLAYCVESSYRRWDSEHGIPRVPFVLGPDGFEQPTELEVEFRADDDVEYVYSFAVDDERVLRESLHSYRTNRRTILFERDYEKSEWYFGPSFRGPSSQLRDLTRDNALFLSVAAASSNKSTAAAYRWLSRSLKIYDAKAYRFEHKHVARRISDDRIYRSRVLSFLRHADLGVDDVSVVSDEIDEESRSTIGSLQLEEKPEPEIELSLRHSGLETAVNLPFDWESDGTQALISFASVAVRALENGSVCVVDEIDTSLHPLLVAELVSVFANPKVNPLQAQLIFTTHDVSLIGRGPRAVLDRDQIWVVEKDSSGASSIVAISEYRTPRKEENLERGYMTGRFGGLPTLSIVNELIGLSESDDPDSADL